MQRGGVAQCSTATAGLDRAVLQRCHDHITGPFTHGAKISEQPLVRLVGGNWSGDAELLRLHIYIVCYCVCMCVGERVSMLSRAPLSPPVADSFSLDTSLLSKQRRRARLSPSSPSTFLARSSSLTPVHPPLSPLKEDVKLSA